MPVVPRKGLWMQDLVGSDNNHTPVKFQGPDNLVFVGEIKLFGGSSNVQISVGFSF